MCNEEHDRNDLRVLPNPSLDQARALQCSLNSCHFRRDCDSEEDFLSTLSSRGQRRESPKSFPPVARIDDAWSHRDGMMM